MYGNATYQELTQKAPALIHSTPSNMSFWQKLRELLLGLFAANSDEYPGARRDLALTVVMAFAALILIVYSTEHEASERLRHAAVVSGTILILGLILARRKLIVIGGIAAFVGFRALIAAVLGFW